MLTLLNIHIRLVADKTGNYAELHGLGNEEGVVMPLVRYFESKRDVCSLSKQKKVRDAVRLFAEYSAANDPGQSFGQANHGGVRPWEHFSRFRSALLHGTFNSETGQDPSNLGWRPSSASKVNRVVKDLTGIFTWIDDHGGRGAPLFNPVVAPTHHEVLMQRAAYELRRGKAFLGHTWDHAIPAVGRSVGALKELKGPGAEPPRFPDALFDRFILKGHSVAGTLKVRDILIALLLNKGGLRLSEPMHLFVEDVSYDPSTGGARVVVKHPSQGDAPKRRAGPNYKNREDYLAQRYGKRPRNLVTGPQHAGWKSEWKEIEVQWFEPEFGVVFWHLWQQYIRLIAPIRRDHPWAFVALEVGAYGRPLTIAAYSKVHRDAVFRAGLARRGDEIDLKAEGLTAHGHRHGYGNRAKNVAGIDKLLVQRMLHHSSPESQDVYTRLSSAEIRCRLIEAAERMRRTTSTGGALSATLLEDSKA